MRGTVRAIATVAHSEGKEMTNSNTLRDVMKADISLGKSGASNCRTGQMKDAFSDLQNGTVYRSDLFQCRKLNISNMRTDLRFRHQAV